MRSASVTRSIDLFTLLLLGAGPRGAAARWLGNAGSWKRWEEHEDGLQ